MSNLSRDSKNILILGGVCLCAWISWFVVINKLSPNNHTELALFFFFLSLFIALASFFGILIYFLRLQVVRNFQGRVFNVSLRQGILVGFLAIFTLIFQLINVLSWWTGLLLVVSVVLLEYYFSSREVYSIY